MTKLQLGISAWKSGDRIQARKYLIAALKEDPQNEQAWSWMYQAAANDKERFECLNRILKINPNNARAKQLIEQLTASPIQQSSLSIPKKDFTKNKTFWIIVTVSGILLVLCCICALALPNSEMSSIPAVNPFKPQAKYIVKGSAYSANISYFNDQGGLEQVEILLPWEKELSSLELGSSLSLVAQNNGAGTITCEIWVNGELVKNSTTTLDYGVVTCTYLIY